MGTRSSIIAKLAENQFAVIYCNYDGYLDFNGRILHEHYRDDAKVRELIQLGDLSSLRPEIGVKHPFDSPPIMSLKEREEYDIRYGNMCRAYGRDRGEIGAEACFYETLAETEPDTQRLAYYWDGTDWFHRSYEKDFHPLDAALFDYDNDLIADGVL